MPMLVQFIDHRNGMVSEADPAVAGTILTQVEFWRSALEPRSRKQGTTPKAFDIG